MWHFNGEDNTTRCSRKGLDSATALAKILSGLYKGEEEEFLRIKPRDGFSMYNPPSWVSCHSLLDSIHTGVLCHQLFILPFSKQELRRAVEEFNSPPPQPEDPGRALDLGLEEDPDISVEIGRAHV